MKPLVLPEHEGGLCPTVNVYRLKRRTIETLIILIVLLIKHAYDTYSVRTCLKLKLLI